MIGMRDMSQMPHETQAREVIMDRILPGFMDRFCDKADDYGESWKLLGAKGQFSDINRKFWKLYYSIWLGQELVGEQPDECAEDIIGHCLILLYILRYEPTPERGIFSSPESGVPAHGTVSNTVVLPEDDPRCAATKDLVGSLVRCELYKGHNGIHLGNIGKINQYQWSDES